MESEERDSGKKITRTYLVSMYVCLGLIAGGMAVSIGLFISGMGEGLCIMFPIALLGGTMLFLHSVMIRNRLLQMIALACMIVTISIIVVLAVGV